MPILATFYTQQEAMAYIAKNKLNDAIVDHDFFSGRYHVLDTSRM